MTIDVKNRQIIWRAKESQGPDVEQILLLPVTLAIESKNTAGDAIGDSEQIISYIESKQYDAVFLRIIKYSEQREKEIDDLLNFVERYGIGLIEGGDSYSPLMWAERVLRKASLHLNSDPIKLARKMGANAQTMSLPLNKLCEFRKYFKV